MAHITIKTKTDASRSGLSIVVDGVEMANTIYVDGFSIDPGDPANGLPPVVTMRVAADDGFECDLPDAVVEAMRAEDVA